jgi:hypothetical protein
MKSVSKTIQVALILLTVAALSSCSLGQAAASPTATAVDVNAVMTSAAATAFVQLTGIAAQASSTTPPTLASTIAPTQAPTQDQALLLLTPTDAAGGLPIVESTPTLQFGLTVVPSLTPFATPGSGTIVTCFNSKYISDVTIPDGTVLKPNEKFTKVWRIQNTGTCNWDQGFGLTLWAGPSMGGSAIYFSGKDKPVVPGGIVDLGIEMRAPPQPGDYVAHWTMIGDQGKTFGADLTVFIKVVK